MVVRLEGPPKSTTTEDAAAARRTIDLIGLREKNRQDKVNINKFLTRTIELTGQGLDPDIASQQAAIEISQQDPQFDKGIAGGFQRFASGLNRAPSTTLTGPIAQQLLSQPVGLDAAKIKAQIERDRAFTAQKIAGKQTEPFKKTPEQKQRDSDIKILDTGKASGGQIREAQERLKALPPGTLFDINEKGAAEAFEKVFDKLKPEITRQKNVVFGFDDKVFGKESFDLGLEAAINEGLKDGIDPASMEREYIKWWDSKVEGQKGQKFQEFQARTEFEGAGDTPQRQPNESVEGLLKRTGA